MLRDLPLIVMCQKSHLIKGVNPGLKNSRDSLNKRHSMTWEEAKDQIAKKHKYPSWGHVLYALYESDITPRHLQDIENEAAQLYARSKWDEAIELARTTGPAKPEFKP